VVRSWYRARPKAVVLAAFCGTASDAVSSVGVLVFD
jgi:hypothetical protein